MPSSPAKNEFDPVWLAPSDMGMPTAVILEGARTPFGSFGGALKDLHPTELAVLVGRAALQRAGVGEGMIEEIVFGNVFPVDSRSAYLARHVGLAVGLPISIPALTLNRLCGSGMEAVVYAAMNILLGRTRVALAGGAENMSMTPYLAHGVRWGTKMGDSNLEDLLQGGLTDQRVNMAMGETAENLAHLHEITRDEQDQWALVSQKRAEAARDAGRLAEEITPVEITSRKGTVLFEHDEFIRGGAVEARLSLLRPAFAEGGTVTAGNSSGINDGASAVVIASEEFALEKKMRPLARIRGWASHGCAPDQMGIGPVQAIPAALDLAGLSLAEMDLIEVNEAFAAQFLAVKKLLNLDAERTNVNGGALAIGHPLGASGNRVLLTLCKELARREARYGVASLCIGGGQGIAMVVENIR